MDTGILLEGKAAQAKKGVMWILLIMGFASIAGGIVALKKAKIGGAILIVSFLLPLFFYTGTALATFFCLIGGILAMVAKEKPAPAQA